MLRVRSSPTPGKPPGKAEKSLCSSNLLPDPDCGITAKGSGFFAQTNPPLALMRHTTLELETRMDQVIPIYGCRSLAAMAASMESEWALGDTPNALHPDSAAEVTKNSPIP